MKYIKITILVVTTVICCLTCHARGYKKSITNWLCYYGHSFGYDMYSKFDLVVLDGWNSAPVIHSKKGKPLVLGYLSIGEINVNCPLWQYAKDKPYLIKKNEAWESWIVDIRNKDWQNLLIEKAIPKIFERGFDGLFLDTLDSVFALEHGDEKNKYRGTAIAAGSIIKNIKKKWPEKLIAVNRGLSEISVFVSFIDFVVIEDLYSYYDNENQSYVRVDKTTQDILLERVRKGLAINPKVKVLTLDYASENEINLAKEAIDFSKKFSFIPYVSTYDLQQIFLYTVSD